MPWLLVDNSNTRTKFALGDTGSLLEWRGVIQTSEVSQENLEVLLSGIEYEAVVVCSVVPAKAAVLRDFFGGRCPVHFLNSQSPLGMGIHYPEPSQIGADRLANAAGILTRHPVPAIIIDFGTAVTFDVISSTPAYCGGVIAPGLGAMSGYLTRKTALLPEIDLAEPPSAIGKSTVHAMQVGAVIGYRGLVKEIIAAISEELGTDPAIIATGGDAGLIARGVPAIQAVDPDITLDGLRQVAVRLYFSDVSF
jgi:type III pantothenate kinase